MADHPWPCGRKALRPIFGLLDEPRRFGRAAATARAVRCLVFGDGPGGSGRALIGGVGLAFIRRHAEEVRRRQNHPRRFTQALRTVLRRIAFRHRPHIRERAAIIAEIFVDRHLYSPVRFETLGDPRRRMRGGRYAPSRIPSRRELYLSCDSGIWMSPLMCLIGPADDGMMSKSKISVGNHSVAQALGTSTTPEM
jgi:hypothetical protein